MLVFYRFNFEALELTLFNGIGKNYSFSSHAGEKAMGGLGGRHSTHSATPTLRTKMIRLCNQGFRYHGQTNQCFDYR